MRDALADVGLWIGGIGGEELEELSRVDMDWQEDRQEEATPSAKQERRLN